MYPQAVQTSARSGDDRGKNAASGSSTTRASRTRTPILALTRAATRSPPHSGHGIAGIFLALLLMLPSPLHVCVWMRAVYQPVRRCTPYITPSSARDGAVTSACVLRARSDRWHV